MEILLLVGRVKLLMDHIEVSGHDCLLFLLAHIESISISKSSKFPVCCLRYQGWVGYWL